MRPKLQIVWDTYCRCKKDEGWYVERYDEQGDIVEDSMKIWFAVDVDQFGRDELRELKDALQAEWPDHEIEEVEA